MAYDLTAIIGQRDVLGRQRARYQHVLLAPLRQGFGLIPLTRELGREIGEEEPGPSAADSPLPWSMPTGYDEWFKRWGEPDRPYPPFWDLSQPILDWLVEISADGPVAYVECQCIGGPCAQTAAVWHRGQLALGPIIDPVESGQPGADGAINAALRHLGASAMWAIDEFEAVGLPTHRRTERWREYEVFDPPPDAWRSVRDQVAPDPISIVFTFQPDPAVVAETRRNLGPAAATNAPVTHDLVLPVRLSAGGQELMGTTDDPWMPLPIARLARDGLACLRWAFNGTTSYLPLGDRLVLGCRVSPRGGLYYVHAWQWRPSVRLTNMTRVSYADLLRAWEAFAENVRAFLKRELPALVEEIDDQDPSAPRFSGVAPG